MVCVERRAVGKGMASMPKDEIIGKATVREHFPIHEMSCIVTILSMCFTPLITNNVQ